MLFSDIIRKKRDGCELTDNEIAFFIREYTCGNIPDYQASALLMAVFLRGLNQRETLTLTLEMAASGKSGSGLPDVIEFDGKITADKHSTGGVGDTTTLVTAPIAAACGLTVAKLSGRGLGFTGGTVDKLEAIPGYNPEIPAEKFRRIADKLGICLAAQSGELAPADKKLYALRDVTATVESLPLIASSIMSKKLASGARCIVLDVKCGSGAFMRTPAEAAALASEMIAIGRGAGRLCSALVTDMNQPLGRAVGNALELREACGILAGRIKSGRLYALSVRLAEEMLVTSGLFGQNDAAAAVRHALDSGEALKLFARLAEEMGGDPAYIHDRSLFAPAACSAEFTARRSGYITKIDAAAVGRTALLLGAGRRTKDDAISHSAGILLRAGIGDYVDEGMVIADIYADNSARIGDGLSEFARAVEYSDEPADPGAIVIDEVRE